MIVTGMSPCHFSAQRRNINRVESLLIFLASSDSFEIGEAERKQVFSFVVDK